MEHKTEEIFHTILRIVVLIAIIGSIALLIVKRDAGPEVAFELLAYVVSITALILTTLQSISISRQVRITRHAAGKITEALNSINELVAVDKKLTRSVVKSTELDEAIALVLTQYSVGKNEVERKKIARSMLRKAKNKH